MLKSITGAVAAGIFGSLILSTSVSAQSGTRITLSDSPQASQTTQSIVDTPPIYSSTLAAGNRLHASARNEGSNC